LEWRFAGLGSFAAKNSRTVEKDREFWETQRPGRTRCAADAAFRLAEARAGVGAECGALKFAPG